MKCGRHVNVKREKGKRKAGKVTKKGTGKVNMFGAQRGWGRPVWWDGEGPGQQVLKLGGDPLEESRTAPKSPRL